MATAKELKKLLEPLLARNDDLVLVGRTIVVRPVRHIMRAVLIDRTSSADVLSPKWYLHHFCTPSQWMHLSWGGDIYRGERKLWRVSDLESPERLASAIEGVLPRLRAIAGFAEFIPEVRAHPYARHHLDWPKVRVVIEAALGNLDAARALCAEKIVAAPPPPADNPEFIFRQDAGARELCRRLQSGDIPGVAALLQQWEAALVKQEKLEPFWERTPFPVETMMGL